MNEKLLLIDDNKHLRITLGDHLAHEGYAVTTMESAEDALAYLEGGGLPDLIILDINMPGLGGVGFLRRILNSDGRPRHPVLVLTARTAMESFFDSVPVDGFLTKPCAVDALLDKIREILASARAAAGSSSPTEPARESMILLGEDDPAISNSIERLFKSVGYRTHTVRSGPDVLEEAPRLKPQLVIIKQLLPKMNGNVIAPVLGTMPSTQRTPILLYDESRRYEDPAIFSARLPSAISRYVPSNRAADLVRAAEALLADGARREPGGVNLSGSQVSDP